MKPTQISIDFSTKRYIVAYGLLQSSWNKAVIAVHIHTNESQVPNTIWKRQGRI